MLRQFSLRRIAGFFLFDWAGTLFVLALASLLRTRIGDLPHLISDLVNSLEITVGGAAGEASTLTLFGLPLGVYALVALIWPFFFIAFSIYDGRKNATLAAELRNVFVAICVSTLVLAGVLYLTYRETSRGLFLLFWVLDLALLLGGRVALWAYRRSGNGRNHLPRRGVLVVGAGEVGQNAVIQLRRFAQPDVNLVGYVDDDPDKQGQRLEGVPVLGTLEQLPSLVNTHSIHAALVALPLRAHEQLLWTCKVLQEAGIRVHVIPDLFALSFPSATLDGFGGIPVIDLGLPGLMGWSRLSKRVFDVLVSILILLFLSPLLAVVAVLIKLESPGPVIYRQERIGKNGMPFIMFKFRSMRADTDSAAHQTHMKRLIEENLSPEEIKESGGSSLKMEADPRITRVGRVIRKTSLDELPQLFNVLRGEMSLVGPRPPLPYEVDLYQDWHKRRLEALPGITGWWQVQGRNRVSFDEAVRMDLYYIQHASFWLDLRILLLTPWAVISGQGAG